MKIGPNGSEKNGHDKPPRQVDEGAAKPERVAEQAQGPGTELASYWVSSGERLLICAAGKGGLEIDRALENMAALWAVVDDYLAQDKRLDAPPMSSAAMSNARATMKGPA